MSGNEVSIVVTADNKTGAGLKDVGKDMDTARTATREYGKHLDDLGEKADRSEARIMGVRDTVDGVATIMAGPGEQGLSAYLQGWADLASGLANAVLPALSALSLSNIKATASTVASTVAQKTAAAATKAWAAAQWVMNAALSANPIGLVVVAVAALVAAIVLAYRHSETFRKVVQAAGAAAVKAFHAVLDKVGDVIGWMRANWPKLLAILTGPVGLAVRWIVKHWDDLVDVAQSLPGRIGRVVSAIYDRLTAPIRRAVTWIAGRFTALVTTAAGFPGRVGRAVAGVYDRLTRPFRDAVGAIRSWIDGLIDRLASLQSSISGAIGRIPGLAHGGITGAAGGGPRSRRTLVGEHGPEIVDLAPGSMVHSNPDSMRMLGQMGGGAGGMLHLTLQIGDRLLGELLLDPVRKVVRTVGGGDVQATFGSA